MNKVMMEKENNNVYNMAFTAGAAMLSETLAVAEAYLDCGQDWELTREKTIKENLMSKGKLSSNQRYFQLMKQRIEVLNNEEIQMLVHGSVSARRQLILLAICKAYRLIFDFINENVRECFYNFHESISYANFNEFFNEKKYEHPEMEKISELSIYKMRQVIFRILEQTELIESAESGELRRPYLTEELERMIVKDDAKWLAIYLYSNNEISNLHDLYA
ncbi:DUF1819 family protein [Parabacteroides sp. HGS0025]|nr:DUF1819 family protein [Parabacteroides sp. HGS0025]